MVAYNVLVKILIRIEVIYIIEEFVEFPILYSPLRKIKIAQYANSRTINSVSVLLCIE